jgi:hypothetical protein
MESRVMDVEPSQLGRCLRRDMVFFGNFQIFLGTRGAECLCKREVQEHRGRACGEEEGDGCVVKEKVCQRKTCPPPPAKSALLRAATPACHVMAPSLLGPP